MARSARARAAEGAAARRGRVPGLRRGRARGLEQRRRADGLHGGLHAVARELSRLARRRGRLRGGEVRSGARRSRVRIRRGERMRGAGHRVCRERHARVGRVSRVRRAGAVGVGRLQVSRRVVSDGGSALRPAALAALADARAAAVRGARDRGDGGEGVSRGEDHEKARAADARGDSRLLGAQSGAAVAVLVATRGAAEGSRAAGVFMIYVAR
ncbi:uncharacterized protein MICPUCDRAFT_69749 [Micromonas pusilla CCMP1545]|uniref:Predicted protein n=1 Tax=Micromonas pusilla (strain CCMP1545) TaxID=564608 RepID=C1MV38_MICPC|nr:uncharacterized protein MICPUCDRAFT_69749 [Micromonas pusilla CCMP1545]EEH56437.1 predicted protein [Micromonas pusilla CCMP1545]|eukprot:XP_003059305.1 predicted protein [Micromonas pusilla CCMP1545]